MHFRGKPRITSALLSPVGNDAELIFLELGAGSIKSFQHNRHMQGLLAGSLFSSDNRLAFSSELGLGGHST